MEHVRNWQMSLLVPLGNWTPFQKTRSQSTLKTFLSIQPRVLDDQCLTCQFDCLWSTESSAALQEPIKWFLPKVKDTTWSLPHWPRYFFVTIRVQLPVLNSNVSHWSWHEDITVRCVCCCKCVNLRCYITSSCRWIPALCCSVSHICYITAVCPSSWCKQWSSLTQEQLIQTSTCHFNFFFNTTVATWPHAVF